MHVRRTNKQEHTRRTASTRDQLLADFHRVRAVSLMLCDPLETEDFVLQAMPDVSPTKWHLAHTTWFFETFVLEAHQPDYEPIDAAYRVLFNSYYNTVGEQFPRPHRGQLSRPTVAQVMAYRHAVDQRIADCLAHADPGTLQAVAPIIIMGLQHEQQHQELILTDIKFNLSVNPLGPVYRERPLSPGASSSVDRPSPPAMQWMAFDEGVREVGYLGEGFCFDNETPRHKTYVHAFEIANRLVTNREYLQFVEAGGYAQPQYWLSAGYSLAQAQDWRSPLYWQLRDGHWRHFTLAGLMPIDWDEPVCHVSFYEADAFARWAGARLPTEFEWELAATASQSAPTDGNFADTGRFHPAPCPTAPGLATANPPSGLHQFFGDVWEWTASQYRPYPGFQPDAGALGEYNGKFMCNQFVLRGGSCATPADHIRPTYRNFFPPEARWQFAGLRLTRNL